MMINIMTITNLDILECTTCDRKQLVPYIEDANETYEELTSAEEESFDTYDFDDEILDDTTIEEVDELDDFDDFSDDDNEEEF